MKSHKKQFTVKRRVKRSFGEFPFCCFFSFFLSSAVNGEAEGGDNLWRVSNEVKAKGIFIARAQQMCELKLLFIK